MRTSQDLRSQVSHAPILHDPRLLVLLASGSLTTMAGGVVAPVLPEMVQQLHLNPGLAGHLVSAHCLTIALCSPPLGILADRVGRLRVLVGSLILYALFGTAGALMSSFGPLLLTRGLLGAASGGIAAASLGLLGSLYEGRGQDVVTQQALRSQALAYATSTLTITGIAFPLVGGVVGASHWQFAFALYGLGLPLALLSALVLQNSQIPTSKTGSNHNLKKTLGNPQVIQLLLTLGLASISMYAVVIYAPLYLKATIGAGTLLNGIVLAARAIGAAVVSAFLAGRISRSWGVVPATAAGFGVMALTLATIPLLNQLGWILVTAVLFGGGFGIVLPNLYSALASLAPAELRSSVLAAGTGAGFLGQFLSPVLLGGVLGHSGLPGAFYAAACVAIAAGCLLMWTPKQQTTA